MTGELDRAISAEWPETVVSLRLYLLTRLVAANSLVGSLERTTEACDAADELAAWVSDRPPGLRKSAIDVLAFLVPVPMEPFKGEKLDSAEIIDCAEQLWQWLRPAAGRQA